MVVGETHHFRKPPYKKNLQTQKLDPFFPPKHEDSKLYISKPKIHISNFPRA